MSASGSTLTTSALAEKSSAHWGTPVTVSPLSQRQPVTLNRHARHTIAAVQNGGRNLFRRPRHVEEQGPEAIAKGQKELKRSHRFSGYSRSSPDRCTQGLRMT
jgi:hypothetical protein